MQLYRGGVLINSEKKPNSIVGVGMFPEKKISPVLED